MPLKVIIVGSGIAGLSLAIMLRPHAHITILERSPDALSMNIRGAGLAQYTPAANILRNNLGLQPTQPGLDMVHGGIVRQWNWWTGHQVRQVRPPTDDWYRAHRGSLLDSLFRRATEEEENGPRPAQVLFSKQVTSVDVEHGSVGTADGSTYDADLIVGAEGVRSVVRSHIVKDALVEPSGFSVYRWTLGPQHWAHLAPDIKTSLDDLVGPLSNDVHIADHKAIRFVTYRCHADGLVNGLLILPDYLLPEVTEDWGAKGSVDHLQSTCSDLATPWKQLVGCVHECGLWQLRLQAPLPHWSKAKAIVIGNAAHPMLPFQAHAAALAMEDAEALHFALSEVDFDSARVPLALQRTFNLRFLRDSIVQHLSNSTPFDPEEVAKAKQYSKQKAASSSSASQKVPLTLHGQGAILQDFIHNLVQDHADVLDRTSTSAWIFNYTSAREFERTHGDRYVLRGPLMESGWGSAAV